MVSVGRLKKAEPKMGVRLARVVAGGIGGVGKGLDGERALSKAAGEGRIWMRTASDDKLQRRYPALHRDGTVSYWSFSKQEWMGHAIWVPIEDFGAMHPYDRKRIQKHLGTSSDEGQ